MTVPVQGLGERSRAQARWTGQEVGDHEVVVPPPGAAVARWAGGPSSWAAAEDGPRASVDLTGVLRTLRRRWLAIVVCSVLGGLAGAAVALRATPMYSSTATVFFSVDSGQTVNELVQGSTYTQNLVQSYVDVATSPVVLTPVITDLDLSTTPGDLARSVSVEAPLSTVLMHITATRTSPEQAAGIASGIAAQLSTAATTLSPHGPGTSALTVTTIAPAAVPTAPTSPHTHLDIAAGVVGGLLLGGLLVLVLETLTATVATRGAVARLTSAPVIGSVPVDGRRRSRPLPASTHPAEPRAEAYRALRTNLRFLRPEGTPTCLVVTSSSPGEGKTSTAVNLAVTLADAGQRVLLVDADLRRPAVAGVLGLEGAAGLSTALSGAAELPDLLQAWGDRGLHVLTSGQVPPNPSELLSSAAMDRLLAAALTDHDVVVVDSPPLLPVTDAAVLAARTDGAVLVVDARRTPARRVTESLSRLGLSGAPVLGVVLNRAPEAPRSYYSGRRRLRDRLHRR